MQSERSLRLSSFLLAATAMCALTGAGCGKKIDTTLIGTFRMGERVQMGGMLYTVLEADWKPALTSAGGGKLPKNRYLFVRISATNSGGALASIPPFTLIGPKDETYMEVTEGLEEVPNHLGVLRTVQPAQTEQGVVIFDAPLAAYKLAISDGAEPGSEKFSRVELPVSLE